MRDAWSDELCLSHEPLSNATVQQIACALMSAFSHESMKISRPWSLQSSHPEWMGQQKGQPFCPYNGLTKKCQKLREGSEIGAVQ